ncbi:hypothetical protein JVU11DRAFT_9748 [Chiua virens]|nr:hypothetical protein JVU11DRAFT_9748 [Chiua virens]
MPVLRKTRKKYNYSNTTLTTKIPCPTCGKSFKQQGFKKHEASCKAQEDDEKHRDRAGCCYEKTLERLLGNVKGNNMNSADRSNDAEVGQASSTTGLIPVDATEFRAFEGDSDADDLAASTPYSDSQNHDFPRGSGSDPAMSISNSVDNQQNPADITDENFADFKTEYHPRSTKRSPVFQTSDTFRTSKNTPKHKDSTPWCPFRCKGDFEFAEIAAEASLNKEQVEALLNLISRVAKGEDQVTFRSEAELRKTCDWAAEELTPFVEHTISVPYKKETLSYVVHVRSLWQWGLDLLNNPYLAPHFVWDAERLYKRNGEQFERFYDEPWTADQWWDVQSSLPPSAENAAPFAFILYADKSKLSSFGTVKGYPIIARCANLPVELRNGNDIGGGAVVGWLPIVPEDANEEGKLGYTTLKRVVWHESFLKLLEEFIEFSKSGYLHVCHDGIERWLFPIILILSADYEEQCMMSLIRGRLGKCPCPVCLVPLEDLHDLSKSFAARSREQAEAALDVWMGDRQRGEEMLKKLGLRPISNVFWLIRFSCDPYLAISFDILHALHLGLWGKHIFQEIKKILESQGRDAQATVEKYVANFPSWRQLTHFKTIINITFNDGNKIHDLAKVYTYVTFDTQIFYSLLHVFKRNKVPEGYALLRMLKSYLELDGLLSLDVHTEHTLSMIEDELLKFNSVLEEYITLAGRSEIQGLKQDWDFPKAHLWKHAVRDIQHKGAARNYSTCPNESMHGALREAYHRRTNYRDVANQILCVDNHTLALKLIRQSIQSQDAADTESSEDPESESITTSAVHHASQSKESELSNVIDNVPASNSDSAYQPFVLGSLCQIILMQSLETDNPREGAFSGYKDVGYIKILPTFKITRYKYLKINYGLTVNWRETTDHLQCNPSFFSKPRYDCALIQFTEDEVAFVRLILVFTCHVPELNGTFEFALVQPFTRRTWSFLLNRL